MHKEKTPNKISPQNLGDVAGSNFEAGLMKAMLKFVIARSARDDLWWSIGSKRSCLYCGYEDKRPPSEQSKPCPQCVERVKAKTYCGWFEDQFDNN